MVSSMPPRSPSRADSGFTLLEILVVLAIMALMMGLVASRGAFHSATTDVNATRDALTSAIRLARTQSMSSGQPRFLLIDPAAHHVTLPAPHDAPIVMTLNPHVQIRRLPDNRTYPLPWRILFFPEGTSTGLRLLLDETGHRTLVTLDPLTSRVEAQPFRE